MHVNVHYNESEEIEKLSCYGHIDALKFREACFESYKVRPIDIKLIFVKAANRKNRKGKWYQKTVPCNQSEPGATPMTIGII